MYTQANEVSSVVSRIETRFTPLLSRMLIPEIFFTVGPGFPTTLFRTEQKPLNCKVAPSRESMTLPSNPAIAERGTTSSCFRATEVVHFVVKNPTITNVSPTTLPAAIAANNPVFVTPPFVPLRTGLKLVISRG